MCARERGRTVGPGDGFADFAPCSRKQVHSRRENLAVGSDWQVEEATRRFFVVRDELCRLVARRDGAFHGAYHHAPWNVLAPG